MGGRLRWRLWVSLVVLAGIGAGARAAHAGCPNACQVGGVTVTVAPALDCLHVTASTDTCDCGVFANFDNECTGSLEAVDFSFPSCVPVGGSSLTQPCPLVAPMYQATTHLKTTSTGSQQWALKVSTQNTSHSVTVTADVTSFSGGGGGCAFATSPAPRRRSFVWLALGAAIFAARARRRRTPPA